MKKVSIIKMIGITFAGLLISLLAMQCTKVGVNANVLNRSMKEIPDSGVFSPFYDSTLISAHDAMPDVNDIVVQRSVRAVIKENCATSNCHGGPLNPKLTSYADLMKYVVAGNPEGSKLWELITTNDFNKAMPPVNSLHELTLTDKTIIYNWIKFGAKEHPGLMDFRPAAIKIITVGCTSANCHNLATATGAWARKGLIPGLTSADTSQFIYTAPGGTQTIYCQLTNVTLRTQVWNEYKDSVRRFYADTLANASFRPYKTFSTPVSASSTRGPLNTYDDIILDVNYPKSARSNSSVQYTDPNGKKFYVKGNYLNVTSSLVSRVDSTLLLANPFTGVYATNHQGDMSYGDGGLSAQEIALIKAWYFADPNVPQVWKYGTNNSGIYKYRKSGTIIKQ